MRQVKLDRFQAVREINYTQHRVAVVFANICQNFTVLRRKQGQHAATESGMASTYCQHPPCPVEKRMLIATLRLDVDGLIPVKRVHSSR